MKNSLKSLKKQIESKTFKFEVVCPYPFDRMIMMAPFPKHFEVPKFDKFRGKGDPITHVKEFFMHYQEVAYTDVFLIHLFSKSLGGLLLSGYARSVVASLKFCRIVKSLCSPICSHC